MCAMMLLIGVDDEPGSQGRAFDVDGLSVCGLDWVTDDEQLILAAEVGDTARLFRMRVSNGELEEIPVREEQVTYPSLSRDGRTLVYEDARARQRLGDAVQTLRPAQGQANVGQLNGGPHDRVSSRRTIRVKISARTMRIRARAMAFS